MCIRDRAKVPQAATAKDQLDYACSELRVHNNQRALQALKQGVDAAMTGAMTPEEAMKQAQTEVEALLAVSYTHLDVYKRQILTCSPQIGEDATAVFNMLSGYSEPLAWNRLSVAPLWLRARCLRMIRRETENALAGREAHIMAKMNSLCDKEIITALYEASHAGVKVELVIRGICCLRAGVPGLSENISVRSIVGNFLEQDVYKRQSPWGIRWRRRC